MKAGWEVRPLGEFAELITKGTTPTSVGHSFAETGINFIKVESITERGDFLPHKFAFISDDVHQDLRRSQLKEGDVLFSIAGALGRTAIVTADVVPANTNQALSLIRLKDDAPIDRAFLVYSLGSASILEQIEKLRIGAAQQNLSLAQVREFPIPLPPLEEQERIVAILDEAFEGLARARAHAEANLQNARELFENVLRDNFRNGSRKWQTDRSPDNIGASARAKTTRSRDSTQTGGREATLRPISGPFSLAVLDPDLPARRGWRWSQLTDLARLESGHTPSRKHPEYWGGDIPWIGIKDARDHHGGAVYATLENTNPLGIANSSARVLPARTVCLSRTASVGYVTIMGRDMATSQDFVNWICGDALLPEFLQLLLMAQGGDIRRFASGSVHQTIYFPEVKAFHICHPPISIQREICDAMAAVRHHAEALIPGYEAKLSNIDALRQSLLQKAFAGELT